MGTYSQIYIQTVFCVKGKANLLHKPWRTQVFKYISGIITAEGQKAIIVNGVSDHVHAFIGMKPTCCLSDLMRVVKTNSSKYINQQNWIQQKFEWQVGYGAFSYSHSAIDNVYNYILNQEAHHRKKTFREEYLEFLRKFQIEHNEKYTFDFLE